jgi:hypothetical protein
MSKRGWYKTTSTGLNLSLLSLALYSKYKSTLCFHLEASFLVLLDYTKLVYKPAGDGIINNIPTP